MRCDLHKDIFDFSSVQQLLELREISVREIDFHYWKFHEDEKIKGA